MPFGQTSELSNLARKIPDFGGEIRYESWFYTDAPEKLSVLQLDEVGDIARLWVNDEFCGSVVGRPYRFDIEGKLRCGENRLRLEAMTNLSYWQRDFLSSYRVLPISGLSGMVWVG